MIRYSPSNKFYLSMIQKLLDYDIITPMELTHINCKPLNYSINCTFINQKFDIKNLNDFDSLCYNVKLSFIHIFKL